MCARKLGRLKEVSYTIFQHVGDLVVQKDFSVYENVFIPCKLLILNNFFRQ